MGLSYPQIAEQMETTEAAVRGLVARGLAALSDVLGEPDGD
jgi:DNA-directed RNA polymerase specialized sigma24 family protein